jgi:hypothetical protein
VRLIVRVEDTEVRTAVQHVFDRSPVRVGRSTRNDLSLPRRFVSAWHGLIDFEGEEVQYTDLGSTNGTLVDGELVEARCAVALGPTAEVAIGCLRITFPAPEGSDRSTLPCVAEAVEPAAPQSVASGRITEMMKKLAAAPSDDFDRACRQILLPGAAIGRFELQREIGRGSFGVVFEAKDRQLGRLVAFKAVRPGRESQVLFRQELLQQEAEAVARLNHPNIVSLHDIGTCESGPYLIMELLKGETLRARLDRQPVALPEALEIAIDVAWALDHAHAAGVVHRDLKPANVFLCENGHVKVLDFGIAHVFGVGALKAVGTPAYMAPEQWRLGRQDARTDIFGAAVMLAMTVTGRLPYRATDEWSAVLEPGARPRLDAPGLPPQLLALLKRALSPDPGPRPRDGHEWLAALLEIHEGLERAQTRSAGERVRARAAAAANAWRGALHARAWRSGVVAAAAVAGVGAVAALAYILLH